MCLYKNERLTNEFLKKNIDKKQIIVWKVYTLDLDDDVRHKYYDENIIRSGWIQSNQQSKDFDDYDKSSYYGNKIFRGIHVYLTREDARQNKDYSCGDKVFKCIAKINDLVAIGGDYSYGKGQAVFMKIHISKKEFEKGKKGRN